ncbi:MAG: hypothetical protein JNJ80_01985 [Gemmatimonadetes bacterium]|nr:hypothetical protein [Gemmatimonadota bacterium]
MADQVQCLRIKLRPGTTDRMVSFLRGLRDRPAEVQASLALEGMTRESLFLERTEQGDYLVFYSRAVDLARAAAAFQTSQLPLDQETMRLIAETWESAVPLELIVDLEPDPASH